LDHGAHAANLRDVLPECGGASEGTRLFGGQPPPCAAALAGDAFSGCAAVAPQEFPASNNLSSRHEAKTALTDWTCQLDEWAASANGRCLARGFQSHLIVQSMRPPSSSQSARRRIDKSRRPILPTTWHRWTLLTGLGFALLSCS